MYDYLLVGAGIHNCVLARILTDADRRVLVIEKRGHIGGNCYDYKRDDNIIHRYGIHAFHTNNKEVWDFLNRFAKFNDYKHKVVSVSEGEIFSFPPNQKMFNKLGTKDRQTIYNKFFKDYSLKQWGFEPGPEVINRIPWREDDNDYYFDDLYQGLPIGGYTKMFTRMLDGIEVRLNTDFLDNIKPLSKIAEKVIYCGPIDALTGDKLPYRSLEFKYSEKSMAPAQETAQMNYADKSIPYTRRIEWSHLYNLEGRTHWMLEMPKAEGEPYYPIANEQSRKTYQEIREAVKKRYPNLIPAGRLGTFTYINMDQAVAMAMNLSKSLLENK